MKRVLCMSSLIAFGAFVSNQTFAQVTSSTGSIDADIDKWSRERGVIVTSDVREQISRNLAFRFATDAPKVGLSTADAWHLGGAIADGGRVSVESRGSANNVAVLTGMSRTGATIASARINIEPPDQGGHQPSRRSFWEGLGDYFKVGEILQTYPQLHLVVQPVPPRDYSVTINGQTYDATDMGLYGVVPGATITVRVERPGKQPCDWSGQVMGGQVQTIACTL